MKCKKCGTEFQEGVFCPECGERYIPEESVVDEPQITVKKCPECGTEFSEGVFCPECGTKVEAEGSISQTTIVEESSDGVDQPAAIPEEPKQSVNSSEVDQAVNNTVPNQPNLAVPEKQKMSKGTISVILGAVSWILFFSGFGAILAVVTSIAGIVFGYQGRPEKKATIGLVVNALMWVLVIVVFIIAFTAGK